MQRTNLFWQKSDIEEFNHRIKTNEESLDVLKDKIAKLNPEMSDLARIQDAVLLCVEQKHQLSSELKQQEKDLLGKIEAKFQESFEAMFSQPTNSQPQSVFQAVNFGRREVNETIEFRKKLQAEIDQLKKKIKSLEKTISEKTHEIKRKEASQKDVLSTMEITSAHIKKLERKIKSQRILADLFPKRDELPEESIIQREIKNNHI